jgi:hypothetical protein
MKCLLKFQAIPDVHHLCLVEIRTCQVEVCPAHFLVEPSAHGPQPLHYSNKSELLHLLKGLTSPTNERRHIPKTFCSSPPNPLLLRKISRATS